MFLGRLPNVLTLDDKGRLVIPSRVRQAWKADDDPEPSEFKLGCLLDKCMYLHTDRQHDAFMDAFEASVDDTEENRVLKTLVTNSFVPVSMDKTGRIGIPAYMKDKAGISKEVVLLGSRERIELWGRENLEALERERGEDFRTSLEAALKRAGRQRRRDDGEGAGE